jgi:fructose-1,6-bisphosphatase/inositol monophosphatase family enzyme
MYAFDERCLLEDGRYILHKTLKDIIRPQIAEALRGASRHDIISVKDEAHWDGADHVTAIDTSAEAFILPAFCARLPGAVGMGEETHDGGGMERFKKGYVFAVDPVDGTNNLVKYLTGKIPEEDLSFGSMVALLRDGKPVAGWIYYRHGTAAEGIVFGGLGQGAFVQDFKGGYKIRQIALREPLAPGVAPNLVMTTVNSYPKVYRETMADSAISDRLSFFEPSPQSAAVETALMLQGHAFAKAGRRFRVWDHAAGFALVEAAGGHAALLNGAPFDVSMHDRQGILFARSREDWREVQHAMLGGRAYDHVSDPPAPPALKR